MSHLSQYTKAVWVYAIHHTLESEGIDPVPVFSANNIDLSAFSSVRENVPRALVNALWLAAEKATSNDALCLKMIDFINEPFINALTSVSRASSSIRQALTILQRFHGLISPELELDIEVEQQVKVRARNTDIQSPWLPEDTHIILAIIAKHGFAIAANEIKPSALHLTRTRPRNHDSYRSLFNCEIKYNASEDCLLYPIEVLDLDIPSADPEMYQHIQDYLESYQKQKHSSQQSEAFVFKVERFLTEQLGPDFPTLTDAAKHSHMSVSAFKKHLQAENSTFQQIADRVREKHACKLIRHNSCSIKEIAYQLGFSNSSAFNRAFKRWKDVGPREYARIVSKKSSGSTKAKQGVSRHRKRVSLPVNNQLSCTD